MTLGEMAGMIDGEHWLPDSLQGTFAAIDEVPTDTLTADFTVIKCKNYTHDSLYRLPVKPSPNLPDMAPLYMGLIEAGFGIAHGIVGTVLLVSGSNHYKESVSEYNSILGGHSASVDYSLRLGPTRNGMGLTLSFSPSRR